MGVEFGRSGTIYDAPPVHPVDFASGAADLEEDLGAGFQAAHIWVTNPTNQYLYLPDVPDVVPPGTFGRVLPCRNTDVGRASWTIPSRYGIQQPVSTGGKAILIFLNGGIDVSPQSGTTDGRTQLPWQAVGSKTTVGAAAENFVTGIVPAGGLTLGISIVGGITSVNVTGVQSGTTYELGTGSQFQVGWITVPINGALDSTYTISWNTSAGAGTRVKAFVSALAMGYPTLGQSAMGESIPVAIASDQTPLPWQAPNKAPKVASGGNVLVAAVAGQTCYLYSGNVAVRVAVAGGRVAIQDTAGTGYVDVATDALGNVPFECHGSPLPVGLGIQSGLISGASASDIVSVSFSQA